MMIVAMRERADGNAEVGTAWIDTALFDQEQPISDVLAWAHKHPGGRLMLAMPTDCRAQNRLKEEEASP